MLLVTTTNIIMTLKQPNPYSFKSRVIMLMTKLTVQGTAVVKNMQWNLSTSLLSLKHC